MVRETLAAISGDGASRTSTSVTRNPAVASQRSATWTITRPPPRARSARRGLRPRRSGRSTSSLAAGGGRGRGRAGRRRAGARRPRSPWEGARSCGGVLRAGRGAKHLGALAALGAFHLPRRAPDLAPPPLAAELLGFRERAPYRGQALPLSVPPRKLLRARPPPELRPRRRAGVTPRLVVAVRPGAVVAPHARGEGAEVQDRGGAHDAPSFHRAMSVSRSSRSNSSFLTSRSPGNGMRTRRGVPRASRSRIVHAETARY